MIRAMRTGLVTLGALLAVLMSGAPAHAALHYWVRARRSYPPTGTAAQRSRGSAGPSGGARGCRRTPPGERSTYRPSSWRTTSRTPGTWTSPPPTSSGPGPTASAEPFSSGSAPKRTSAGSPRPPAMARACTPPASAQVAAARTCTQEWSCSCPVSRSPRSARVSGRVRRRADTVN